MKIENQVCTLEQAKRLKELGVKQESLFKWCFYLLPIGEGGAKPHVEFGAIFKHEYLGNRQEVSAFTVAELGEMLPPYLADGKGNSLLTWFFDDKETKTVRVDWFEELGDGKYYISSELDMEMKTEAEARAAMLIHLLETGTIKP